MSVFSPSKTKVVLFSFSGLFSENVKPKTLEGSGTEMGDRAVQTVFQAADLAIPSIGMG